MCLAASGARGTARTSVTVGYQVGTLTETFSVDTKGLSASGRLNLRNGASASLTVHGSGMGMASYTSMIRSSMSSCESTEWESETSVRCSESHGAGTTRRVSVTSGRLLESLSTAASFDLPKILRDHMQNFVEVREHLIEKHRKGMHALPIPTPAPVGFDSVDNFSSVATSGLVALCSISCSAVTRRSMQTKMRTS